MLKQLHGLRRWRRGLAAALLVLGCGGLASCGGGSGGSGADGPSAESDVFPLSVGDRWVYRAWTGDDATNAKTQLVHASSGVQVQGQPAVVMETTEADSGLSLGQETLSVARAAATQWLDPASALARAGVAAVDVLRFPASVGASYVTLDKTVDAGVDYDGDGRHDSTRTVVTVNVVAIEAVQTLAGSFDTALHVQTHFVRTRQYASGVAGTVSRSTVDDWYVRGIGLVRQDQQFDGEPSSATQHLSLERYAVGGVRSETDAPVATLLSPMPAPAVQGSLTIRLHFGEFVQPNLDGMIDLRDASGALVPVSAARTGLDWTVVPIDNGLLATGSYTLSLAAGVTDLLGNAGAGAQWRFDIDRTGPTVVATSIPQDARYVPVDSVFTIDFSEELDAGSIANVELLGLHSQREAIGLSLQGRRLKVTPQARLTERTAYTLSVGGVRDRSGNTISPGYSVSFRTDPGVFDYPLRLSVGLSPEAVAVGDVNGDGLADVVTTGTFSIDPLTTGDGVFVVLQHPDGTLAPPIRLATRASPGCPARSVAVADMDGDGRNDVVIGEIGCGIEILYQDAAGQLSSSRFLPSTESYRIRVADLDGDGRQDIVGIGIGTGQVSIWRQGGSGVMAAPELVALNPASREDIDIGDVNGDGRPDIIVSSLQAEAGRTLAILYQRPDGSFGDARYLALGVDPIVAVAVGDIDGDGRADIVVSASNGEVLGVLRQDSSGQLAPMQSLVVSGRVEAIRIVDVDGDGRRDIVTKNGDGFGVLMQRPDGTLAAARAYDAVFGGPFNPQSIATGDINGDGRIDLVGAGLGYVLQRAPAAGGTGSTAAPAAAAEPVPRTPVIVRGVVPEGR